MTDMPKPVTITIPRDAAKWLQQLLAQISSDTSPSDPNPGPFHVIESALNAELLTSE